MEIISKTLNILNEYSKWEDLYAYYLQDKHEDMKISFDDMYGLSIYTQVNYPGLSYALSYEGVRVGQIICYKGNTTLFHNYGNKANFGLELSGNSCGWDDTDAIKFRKFFKNLQSIPKDIPLNKFQVRDRLVYELSKRNKADGKLSYNVSPVIIHGAPTMFYAPVKAPVNGGNPSRKIIDILSRVKMMDDKCRICIMMIADPNNESNSQSEFMADTLSVSVFIAKLLRSKSGEGWWAHFMDIKTNTTSVPKKIDIDVVTVMPEGHIDEFSDKEIVIPELATTFHCHSLYYNKSDYKKGRFSFSGTYSLKMIKS